MKRVLAIAGVLAIFASPWSLRASLGSDRASVETDRAKLQGQLQSTTSDAFTVHEIQAASGVKVREYVSPGGKVFAVAWRGPFHPDLRQVLGSYYEEYMKAAESERANRHGHGPLLIEEPGLVMEISGHLRSFWGRAYVPQMLPANVRAEDIK